MPMLNKRLKDGEVLVGTLVGMGSPEAAEALSLSGMQWLFVDMEHSAMGIGAVQSILQAAAPATPCLVRPPAADEGWLKKSLDIGPAGLIVPHVNTADEARRVIRLTRYPPLGGRSIGIARAQGYGLHFEQYLQRANDEVAIVLQIEHRDAVDNIESIAAVKGIDGLYIGPYDLSASMGKPGAVNDPDVQEAIGRVETCAREAGIPLGIFVAAPEAAGAYIRRGYQLITVGVDALMLAQAAKRILSDVKR